MVKTAQATEAMSDHLAEVEIPASVEAQNNANTKPWLAHYPATVPHEIAPLTHDSLVEMLLASFRNHAKRTAFTCMGRDLTYQQLDLHSRSLAGWLQQKGLRKGDRIAIMMPNILHYPIAIAAILRAGMVIVNVNPLYTPRELQRQLTDSGAKAIIVLENFAVTLEQALAHMEESGNGIDHIIVGSMGDLHGFKGKMINFAIRHIKKLVPRWTLPAHTKFIATIDKSNARHHNPAHPAPNDLAFLQYTGGTTGVSKGAMLTHANILSNIEQMELWLDVAFRIKGKPAHINYVCVLPLYHIFALTVNAMIGIRQGARNVLIPNPRDIPALVSELRKYKFHIFPGLNTLFNVLMKHADFKKIDFSQLILSIGGGMPVQRQTAERWQAMTHCQMTEGYGLSETSPVVSANPLDATEFNGTIGLPMPSTAIAIRDDEGRDLPIGQIGEICISGPQVMSGYWNRPDETANAISADGFFRTGDMGVMDEQGFTKIVDRKKDMILVSGFNVYPNEIEEVVSEHPGITEAAAIGIANEHSGEVVKLFVVRNDPNLSEDEIKDYCAQRLTNYKRPREIEFRPSLPKSNVGKILRRELRDQQN